MHQLIFPFAVFRSVHFISKYSATFVLCILLFSPSLSADTVKLKLPGTKVATATWIEGSKAHPAIIVLHGFLQTRTFRATSNIIEGLSSQGYAILGPNLSLGISSRQQSMQCKAAHQHTFGGDLKEIQLWVRWLKAKGFKSFIIVAHSWGSKHGLGFSNSFPEVPVKAVIAISLIPPSIAKVAQDKQISYAQKQLANKSASLQKYKLSYCKQFTSTPASYLSYASWGKKKIISNLLKLEKRKVPVYVILGSSDRRVSADWIATMKKHSKLIVVKGANHFFSSVHELELTDKLEAILGKMAQ